MGFAKAQKLIAQRAEQRRAVISNAQSLKAASGEVPVSDVKALPHAQVSGCSPDTDFSAKVSEGKRISQDIRKVQDEVAALQAELSEAQAFKAKLIKYGAIGGVILVLIILFSVML